VEPVLDVRLAAGRGIPTVVGIGVPADDRDTALGLLDEADRAEAAAFLDDVDHSGSAGTIHALPRPGRRPERWLFVGTGNGGEAGWRAAGAALVRAARKEPALTVLLPADIGPAEVGGLAEGAWLAGYRFRLGTDAPDSAPKLRRLNLVIAAPSPELEPVGVLTPESLAARSLSAAAPPSAGSSEAMPSEGLSSGARTSAVLSTRSSSSRVVSLAAEFSEASAGPPSSGGPPSGALSSGAASSGAPRSEAPSAAALPGAAAASPEVLSAEAASAVSWSAEELAAERAAALARAQRIAEMTILARDLTNTPSDRKTPAWIARQVEKAAAGVANLSFKVRLPKALAEEGFNGILAVGGGSTRGPRLVELAWRPRGARRHVVLIGKGITFDTGGICIKTTAGMKLMRKDMGGAAAVLAATIGAAHLGLPVKITALAPLAENALGADSFRPGDVVRHYGGVTSEITNTDAEGRVVLADAIAYAVRRLRPDLVVDLATLTGAQSVALGKRTAALFSESDALATAIDEAARSVGEPVWRMPLDDDYVEALGSDVADLVNSTDIGAGSVMAALYLREFTGPLRDRWAHIDMSSSAWSDGNDAELVKGATGWGVRTLLRWLESSSD
jgi:leucyl aminopeptidase